ncbi:MAG: hypothetical protein ACLRXC_04715 [[Clostridium] leptum]
MEFKINAYAPAASKPLGHGDESGFEFSKEMLGDDCTAAINFDRRKTSADRVYHV